MSQDTISLHNKQFASYLSEPQLAAIVRDIGTRINADYAGKTPILLAILNGSFMFVSDLAKEIAIDCEIAFMRVASYVGTTSSGEVKEILGLLEDVRDRHVIIVEDIVDTGHTMQMLLARLQARQPASLEVACLLLKPESLQHQLDIKYIGTEIPNEFVVGYGLDYDGLGRNYRSLYRAV